MEPAVARALTQGGLIDITTIGARTGTSHRIEIGFQHLDGDYFMTGRPGRRRDWLANLKANPDFTVHLTRSVVADVPARAFEITDQDERARVLRRILVESWGNEPAKADHILPRWVEQAPLVQFTVDVAH